MGKSKKDATLEACAGALQNLTASKGLVRAPPAHGAPAPAPASGPPLGQAAPRQPQPLPCGVRHRGQGALLCKPELGVCRVPSPGRGRGTRGGPPGRGVVPGSLVSRNPR